MTKFKKGHTPWNKGKKCQHSARFGKSNPNWSGDKVKYFGLHKWVLFNKGKANKCEMCGEIVNIQWANKSHNYKRDLDDWIALCIPCHRAYDKGRSDIKDKIYRHDFRGKNV
jgi:hypothetical protein